MRTPLRERLSRRTTDGRLIPEIDGLRFVAIAMVVAIHVNGIAADAYVAKVPGVTKLGLIAGSATMQAFQVGRFGVHLFFVISGFVLALPFVAAAQGGEKSVSLSRYYLRRVTRLEPPYLVMLTIVFVMLLVTGKGTVASLAPSYAAGAVYLHGPIFGAVNPINFITWSLEIEVQFYVAMPLLALVFRIRDARVRRLVIVAAALIVTTVPATMMAGGGGRWLTWTLIDYLQFFLMGFLLADLYVVSWKRVWPRARIWTPVAIVAWIVLFGVMRWAIAYMDRSMGPARWLFPFAILAAFIASLRSPLLSRWLATPWIYLIGGMCYSLYLTHIPVLRFFGSLTDGLVPSSSYPLDLAVHLLVLVPLVLGVGVAFFVLVERPCMNPRWPQDLAARLRRPREGIR